SPPLTTVFQDTKRAGELLVETLLRQIGGEQTQSITLPASLVVRKSSGA
ncbi:MAG TPA: substrate-binding domain-containing protein, partial [Lysobacter sp.]